MTTLRFARAAAPSVRRKHAGSTGSKERLKCGLKSFKLLHDMATLDQIERQVEQLPAPEKKALLQWLEDLLEDELEFTDEFKAKIERAKRDVTEGRGRVVKP